MPSGRGPQLFRLQEWPCSVVLVRWQWSLLMVSAGEAQILRIFDTNASATGRGYNSRR